MYDVVGKASGIDMLFLTNGGLSSLTWNTRNHMGIGAKEPLLLYRHIMTNAALK
ncbi:MAG: hypothetical protein RR501_01615 [Cloacibacillus sp.]